MLRLSRGARIRCAKCQSQTAQAWSRAHPRLRRSRGC
ncbi:hypothetical protein HY478_02220, partial [Candidatus Uhrbacteria bacterium]|nr:hypothetical protein [Candidatus Uhrbacteria bacterium]